MVFTMSDDLSVRQEAPVPARVADPSSYDVHDSGPGWVAFAGIMLLVVGCLNVVYGIAATSDHRFFRHGVDYITGDLKTWGWFMLGLGALQILAAFSVWRYGELGRWFGVFCAGGNAVIQMFMIPAYPFLSLTLFAVDIMIIYGLASYGGAVGRPAAQR
jgi:hypothetical protein